MLDIGTRADDYAISKLYKYMLVNDTCGGCCGEIEVDFSEYKLFDKYMIRAA
jgi:cellulose synthase/poly-beta-1,6-N-acetylglucosamine synthase-like glycosyltransferase